MLILIVSLKREFIKTNKTVNVKQYLSKLSVNSLVLLLKDIEYMIRNELMSLEVGYDPSGERISCSIEENKNRKARDENQLRRNNL